MKINDISFGNAIFLLVAGLLLGSVFTFGMQYWNADVTKEACMLVETRFVSYEEIRQRGKIKEIAIDCDNEKRYFIDGVSINTELRNAISELSNQENITLLIHPNSSTILELSNENGCILTFDDTIKKLGNERTGFLFIGIFMYFCALVGLYNVILDISRR